MGGSGRREEGTWQGTATWVASREDTGSGHRKRRRGARHEDWGRGLVLGRGERSKRGAHLAFAERRHSRSSQAETAQDGRPESAAVRTVGAAAVRTVGAAALGSVWPSAEYGDWSGQRALAERARSAEKGWGERELQGGQRCGQAKGGFGAEEWITDEKARKREGEKECRESEKGGKHGSVHQALRREGSQKVSGREPSEGRVNRKRRLTGPWRQRQHDDLQRQKNRKASGSSAHRKMKMERRGGNIPVRDGSLDYPRLKYSTSTKSRLRHVEAEAEISLKPQHRAQYRSRHMRIREPPTLHRACKEQVCPRRMRAIADSAVHLRG
eukprot:6198301-Pleurochrysis_carterae.AAC.1